LPREPLSVQLNATACRGVAADDIAEDSLEDLLEDVFEDLADLDDDDFEEDWVAMELFPVGRSING
jgi:hypothetical protein